MKARKVFLNGDLFAVADSMADAEEAFDSAWRHKAHEGDIVSIVAVTMTRSEYNELLGTLSGGNSENEHTHG